MFLQKFFLVAPVSNSIVYSVRTSEDLDRLLKHSQVMGVLARVFKDNYIFVHTKIQFHSTINCV